MDCTSSILKQSQQAQISNVDVLWQCNIIITEAKDAGTIHNQTSLYNFVISTVDLFPYAICTATKLPWDYPDNGIR